MGPLWWDLGGCEVLTLGQLDIFTFKVGYPPSKLKDSKQYIFIHISASRCPIDILFVSKDTSDWSLHIIGHFLELDIRRPSWNPRWRPRKLIIFARRSKVLPLTHLPVSDPDEILHVWWFISLGPVLQITALGKLWFLIHRCLNWIRCEVELDECLEVIRFLYSTSISSEL